MKIKFVKTESAGNDFVLFDRLGDPSNEIEWKKIVPGVCSRRRGVGGDGVLILEKSKTADFKMRIFNPDGSEVKMCGNGARCCAMYYFEKKRKKSVKFLTGAGPMKAENGKDGMISLFMPEPKDIRLDVMINLNGKEISGSFINTGVPHFVVETNRLNSIEVVNIGRKIRYNNEFAPEGTNADFVSVAGKSSLRVRTYERGVEDETPACGTGVVASAITQVLRKKATAPVRIQTEGGGKMKVYFEINREADLISRVYNVKLQGKARKVFEGEVEVKKFMTNIKGG